jgi:trimeric autotransporter adhesin
MVKDLNGSPLTGMVGITFALYPEQTGGTALWLETQNVTADSTGRYTVLLGSTTIQGLPESMFTSEQAHWVGVQVSGQAEQPRVLLVSAPYALKAGDAETVGGLPPSAFVLAAPGGGSAGNSAGGNSPNASLAAAVGGSGTADFIPLWTAAAALGNSVLFQSGSGSSAMVGLNTTTPAATLDVNGGVISRGTLQLPSTGTANASQGFNSQPFDSITSVFNSTGGTAQNQDFRWLAEPVGNNTSSASGKLDLLFGANGATPSETGLSVANNGIISFAAGQTFGGGGGGTVTSVGSGLGLKGGPITTSGTLTIDTTVVPQLGAANAFTGNQTVAGTLTAATSSPFGLIGTTSSTATFAAGVEGGATATTGGTIGVYGDSQSSAGYGVFGEAFSLTGTTYGVYGQTESSAG